MFFISVTYKQGALMKITLRVSVGHRDLNGIQNVFPNIKYNM